MKEIELPYLSTGDLVLMKTEEGGELAGICDGSWIFAPTDDGMAVCPPALKTASPSFIALPVILTNPQNSSTASSEKDTVRFLILDTFVGTVKELDTVAAPNADNA